MPTRRAGRPKIYSDVFGRPEPGIPGMNYIDVGSVDDYIAKFQANGGTLVRPTTAIPEVGYAAICNDTEGNPIGLFQTDSAAA